jgi:predicted acylesterase/phospholipase RssA
MIQHLVINGGGPTGWMTYGAVKHLLEKDFIHLDNIKSIYGTSAGAILGAIFLLKHEWKTLDDYFLKRPWDKVFKVEPNNFFEIYYKKGLFQFSMVEEILIPLMTAKDLSKDITLKEFYENTKIDFHCFTVEINSFEKVDLNHKTHPDLSLIKALEMTSAVPILFSPVIDGDKCYIDGGLLDNYPVNECLKNEKCDETEMLGIRNRWNTSDVIINNEMNFFQYLQSSIGQIVKFIQKGNIAKSIRYELKCLCNNDLSDHTKWLEYMTDEDKRKELINEGKRYAELFINYEEELGRQSAI